MRVHCLQHDAYEDLGVMQPWFVSHGYQTSTTRLDLHQPLPSCESIDWLVVMGGGMSVHDDAIYPWLQAEKALIASLIDQGKPVLGICLGGQLISAVLGGEVTRNPQPEVGWYPIAPTSHPFNQRIGFSHPLPVMHWHGETFSLPAGAALLSSSALCPHQGFIVGDRVVGLQYHPEQSRSSLEDLIADAGDDFTQGPTVQSFEQMRGVAESQFLHAQQHLFAILNALHETLQR